MNIQSENSSLFNIRDLYATKKRALKGSTIDAIFITIASHIEQLSVDENIWVCVVKSFPVHVKTVSIPSYTVIKNTIVPMVNVDDELQHYICSKLEEQGMKPIGPDMYIYKF